MSPHEAVERHPVVPMKPVGPINDTDMARKFLIRYMAANFDDRTFMRYIRDELAGDFAFQLARALTASEAKADRLESVNADLVDELMRALPFLEDMIEDKAYKNGVVAERIKNIRVTLTKAGAA